VTETERLELRARALALAARLDAIAVESWQPDEYEAVVLSFAAEMLRGLTQPGALD
jgi:hypothetical protein